MESQDVKHIEGILASRDGNLELDYIRYWLNDLAELWIENDLLGNCDKIERAVGKRLRDAVDKRGKRNRHNTSASHDE